MSEAEKERTPPEELRLAADLLDQANAATSERERESAYFQAMILISQILDAMMQVELENGTLTMYLATVYPHSRLPHP